MRPETDPWFHFQDTSTTQVYPGDQFGLREPIPSIRVKIQRSCLQGPTLLDILKNRRPEESASAGAAENRRRAA